jgi:tRNA(Ile)-lysidine synthase
MPRLAQHFLRSLTGPCRVSKGMSLAAAVSGGPDSMALLHLLADARKPLLLKLTAVWVDHGLRPLETPREQETVAAAAERLSVPLQLRKVEAAAFAKAERLSLEHAARELRYAALREAACGSDCIAVAHTADDQAEEVLLRMLRGGGRKGLAGMKMRSGSLIRPLLRTGKEELLAWLAERGIAYCLDSSNSDRRFLRNRVRHELLPFLREHFDPGINNALLKTADSLAADEELLEELTESALRKVAHEEEGKVVIHRQRFCELRPALQRRVLELLLWRVGSRASYEHILLLAETVAAGRSSSELHLSQGLRAGIFRERLELSFPVGKQAWRGRLLS